MTMPILWTLLAFFSGALPFAVWLGRGLAGADVRHYGDGNPGTSNAWKAGGWRIGVLVLALDYLKGALPVGLAHFAGGITGWALFPVALAPVAGHAFSPFLGGRGGKGLAVTFGIWSGVTLAEAPIMLGLFMALFYFVLDRDAWAVLGALLGLLAHLLLRQAEPALLALALANFVLLAWTHRRVLRPLPGPSARVLRLVKRTP